jgi:hypothetical protein
MAAVEVRVIFELSPERRAQLDRIERLQQALAIRMEIDMSELDDRLDDLAAAEDSNTAALARLIADFEGAGNLTDDQRAKLDALKQHIVDNQAAIDAADPAPAPPADGGGESPEPPAVGDGTTA